jgi:hypothetical protein
MICASRKIAVIVHAPSYASHLWKRVVPVSGSDIDV